MLGRGVTGVAAITHGVSKNKRRVSEVSGSLYYGIDISLCHTVTSFSSPRACQQMAGEMDGEHAPLLSKAVV